MLLAVTASESRAEKQYGLGMTDTEIRIGITNPYSGNASTSGQNRRVWRTARGSSPPIIRWIPPNPASPMTLHFQRFAGEHWQPFGELMTYDKN